MYSPVRRAAAAIGAVGIASSTAKVLSAAAVIPRSGASGGSGSVLGLDRCGGGVVVAIASRRASRAAVGGRVSAPAIPLEC